MTTHLIMGFPTSVVVQAEKVYDRLRTVTTEEEAVEALRGESYSVFQFIDEKPGYIDGKYHYCEGWRLLRCARNNSESHLFDVLVRG